MHELEALVTLNQLPKIGPIRIKRLIQHFGCASEVLSANQKTISEVKQCGDSVAEIIANWRKLTDTEFELKECDVHGIEIITPESDSWPDGLRDSRDAPILLYVWGSLSKAEKASIAVVGSRKTTNYGRTITHEFSNQLAHNGHPIVSGLALGIDTIAHKAALDSGAHTIAVLGSGLASIYPRQNIELAHAISEQGAVVSEYPLRTPPDKQTFPQRNRIVAAWAQATLVTEMPERSGALITANFARELNRPVYAIPGPIDRPSSAGCNLLIQQGATLATSAKQISQDLASSSHQMDFFSSTKPKNQKHTTALTDNEVQLFDQLASHEQSIEELHIATQLPVSEITIALFNLELHGMAKQHPGMVYTII